MAAVRRLRRLRRRQLPRPRVFYERDDPLNRLDDSELFERFRFRRGSILFIEEQMRESIKSPTRRSFAVLPMMQAY
ncbi:hypothetical protein SNE40_016302 [Patella caerulea]|uniref:Uncharacterized protein n=1 Tax=Patella caerulea TaxID=87958 RepID=A0AAN8PIP0_PATCE